MLGGAVRAGDDRFGHAVSWHFVLANRGCGEAIRMHNVAHVPASFTSADHGTRWFHRRAARGVRRPRAPPRPGAQRLRAVSRPGEPVPGPLSGVPYAAKDIFAAPDRAPHGGLAQPLPPGDCRTADALRLMDEAGAVRLGYTALTEIAYEPSGYNAVLGRVRNPWNPDFISGRIVVRLGGARSRAVRSCSRSDPTPPARCASRRMAAASPRGSRPCGGLDARRDAACALARQHRVARARRRRDRAGRACAGGPRRNADPHRRGDRRRARRRASFRGARLPGRHRPDCAAASRSTGAMGSR